jgi:hypothetical protein
MEGRRRKNPAECRNQIVRICLTEQEKAAVEQLAHSRGLDVSTWLRSQVLQIIREQPTAQTAIARI